MERKQIRIKRESNIKKTKESRTEFSNERITQTAVSEIFSESSLLETEILTNRNSEDREQCPAEKINRKSTESKSCLDSPKTKNLQKNDLIKPAISGNFNQMKDLNRVHGSNLSDNKPSFAADYSEDVNVRDLNEVQNSSQCFKGNPSEVNDSGKNFVIDLKCVGCNPSNGLHSNIKEDFENSNSGKSLMNNQENGEPLGMKLKDDKIIVHNTCDIPEQIRNRSALSLTSTAKSSDSKTELNNLHSRSPNLGSKNSGYAVHSQNRIRNINKRKEVKNNRFFKNGGDICVHGNRSPIKSHIKEKNNKFGVFKGKENISKSVCFLVNYFENMDSFSSTENDEKSVASTSDKRKKSKPFKRTKRKLTDDHDGIPNKRLPFDDSLNSSLSISYYTAEKSPRKTRYASKNIALLKKLNEDVKPRYSHSADTNFNFNDNAAEFCVVKCRTHDSGSKKIINTPRQTKEKNHTFTRRDMNQPNNVLRTPKSPLRRCSDSQKCTPENVRSNLVPDKSPKTKEKIDVGNSSSIDYGKTSVGETRQSEGKDEYKHKKFNKASLDERKLRISNLDLEKKMSMNNPFRLRKRLKVLLSKTNEPTYKEETDKSLEKETSSFIKYFSILILFMTVFALGSYYQF